MMGGMVDIRITIIFLKNDNVVEGSLLSLYNSSTNDIVNKNQCINQYAMAVFITYTNQKVICFTGRFNYN